MGKKEFTKLTSAGGSGGLTLYLPKRALKHLRVNQSSDICLTYNKNGTITISKASFSDKMIEEITLQLERSGNI